MTGSLSRKRNVRPGWRYFDCDPCHIQWREMTRDFESPSHSYCPICEEAVFPDFCEDENLPVDRHGNLDGWAKQFADTPNLLTIPNEIPRNVQETLEIEVDERDLGPTVFEGQKIICPECSYSHALRRAKDEKGALTDAVMFFECPKTNQTYIAAIRGQLMDGFRRELH